MPYNPDLELGDGLLETLGINAEDLSQTDNITKKEEEDLALEKIKDKYGFEDTKETMDEGQVPETIYLFYGGDSNNFSRSLQFIGLSPINKAFGAFLMSDLGRQVMTEKKLSIHIESGDIFYENRNTGENFYNFLLAQRNDDAAFILKTFSYCRSFESYISQFLQAFSIDDIEKYDLFAHKNSKHLFYRFNDDIKAYGNSKQKIKYTRKMLDSVGVWKIEEKNKQLITEKLIHGVEFKNPYNIETEKRPGIKETVESNYRVARRVYQQLHLDISELFAEFIRSIGSLNLQNMDNNIKDNGWGIKKITR